jgi:manganese efflux pump family protein
MAFWVAFLTGIGLSMDAVAASISTSSTARRIGVWDALKIAFLFGFFQALMPALGYAFGVAFRGWIEALDHWVAFILLGFIGAKMIYESFHDQDNKLVEDPFGTVRLLILSIATSIDALAAGVSFSLLGISLPITVAIIGLVTFSLCLPAVWIGKRLGVVMAKRAELLGGLLLIAIGFKILIEHLSASPTTR